ncbi:MAG: NF038122 family metalloprotease [Pseudomonadota bacterium]
MKKSIVLKVGAAAVAAALAAPSFAANIVLHDTTGSFSTAPNGAAALLAFQKAANFWNQTLTNNATIDIQIGFKPLGTGILGSTGSTRQDVSVSSVYGALAATGNSALDVSAVSHLVPLNQGGLTDVRVNAYLNAATQTGIDPTKASRILPSNVYASHYLYANTSVMKALNLPTATHTFDASITFSSSFAFDFNPTNGIDNGKYDFTAVAVHELGHALGFVSGADFYDVYGGKGPGAASFGNGDTWNDESVGSTLDLFRYSATPEGNGTRDRMWGANKTAFFSIDGGASVYNLPDTNQEAAFFSTGSYNGDGNQASHWKDNLAVLDLGAQCYLSTRAVGIMDPTMAACANGIVTGNDLAAFDAMGWNLSQNILANPGYAETTAQIYARDGLAQAVPEPETYAMLLAGLGLTAFAARRRKAAK